MATNTTTPAQRIKRLVNEGVRILAVHTLQPGIDVTHDIVGLLETVRENPKGLEPVAESAASLAV